MPAKLISATAAAAGGIAGLNNSMVGGRFETGALAETFQATGERAASLAQHQHEQARTLVASFEAPFKACSATFTPDPNADCCCYRSRLVRQPSGLLCSSFLLGIQCCNFGISELGQLLDLDANHSSGGDDTPRCRLRLRQAALMQSSNEKAGGTGMSSTGILGTAGVRAAGEERAHDNGGPVSRSGGVAGGARRGGAQAVQAHEAARHARHQGAPPQLRPCQGRLQQTDLQGFGQPQRQDLLRFCCACEGAVSTMRRVCFSCTTGRGVRCGCW